MASNSNLELPIDEVYQTRLEKLRQRYQVDYFNARFNANSSTFIMINKGKMKENQSSNDFGFSIQTFIDGGYGFATSNEISLEEIERIFENSARLAKWSSKKAEEKFQMDQYDPIRVSYVQPQKKHLFDVSNEEKIRFLLEQDKQALRFDPRITNTNSIYLDNVTHEILVTSDDRIIDKTDSRARIMIMTNSNEGSVIQGARKSKGITGGFEVVDLATDLGIKAAKEAIENLNSKPVKGGEFNIIADPYLAGTFIHEAFGHACEADGILAGESQLAGMIGKSMGKDIINVIDEPGSNGKYGFLKYDSEGIEGKPVQLIKDGILTEFMHNRETASKMEEISTGNGRAESYTDVPLVRMRNTYIQPGDWTLEELLEDLKDGILCVSWNYGYTEPSIGQFMFKMERAWEIKNGEKTQLLRDAALAGMMLDILNSIVAIGKHSFGDDGTCGKGGQGVPVCSGSPYIRLNDIVIGGI
jgi:TldD protein